MPKIGIRDSDPAKKKYGTIVYGLKLFIDGLSEASGFSSAQVVAGIAGVGFLGTAAIIAAAVILMRDAIPSQQERPAFDTALTAPNAIEAPGRPSPAPFGSLGQSPDPQPAPSYRTLSLTTEPLPASPEEAPPQEAAAPPKHKPAEVKNNPMENRSWAGLQDIKSRSVDSKAEGAIPKEAGSSGDGRFTGKLKAEAGGYGGDIPAVPDITGGTVLGAQGASPAKKKQEPEAASASKKKPGKTDGPVVQADIPDTGPGKQLSAAPSAGSPSNGSRVEKSGDILTTPVDVNRIGLDPAKANNVDQSGGVIGIGK